MKTDFQLFVLEARLAILGMANNRKYTLDRLSALKEPIANHLSYIVAFPCAQEQGHWRKEIKSLFHQVIKLVETSKVAIPKDLLLHLFYEGFFGRDQDRRAMLRWAESHMNQKSPYANFLSTDFESLVSTLVDDPSHLWNQHNS